MKILRIPFAFVIFCLFLAGCSPRVQLDIIKTYPVTTPPDSVKVFKQGDTIPSLLETLGTISIKDANTIPDLVHEKVMGIAKSETSKVGGNALEITEAIYSAKTLSYILSGILLRIESNKKTDMKVASEKPLYSEAEAFRIKRLSTPLYSLDAGIGVGWIVSKIMIDKDNTVKGERGLNWFIDVEQVGKKGIGVKFQYTGFRANIIKDYYTTTFSFLGPSILFKGSINNFILKADMGIGYFGLKEDIKTPSTPRPLWTHGYGVTLGFSGEYMLNKYFGVGAGLNLQKGFFPGLDDSDLEEGQYYGAYTVSLNAGLHYYF